LEQKAQDTNLEGGTPLIWCGQSAAKGYVNILATLDKTVLKIEIPKCISFQVQAF